ncbi:MAG TPA: hypothetical protein VIK05_14960, partial [Ilumatobacteraceae bacterium]
MTRRNRLAMYATGVLAVVAVGCSDNSSDVSVSGVGSTPPTTAAAPETTAATATTAPSTAASTPATTGATSPAPTSGAPLGDPVVALTKIDGFDQPVEVAFRPTDGATYVVEQDGLIVMLTNGQAGATALDMTDLTNADGERGLLGLAITKDGSLAYVNYTNNDGNTRIDEYTVNADGTFDTSTRREVLGF